MKRLHVTTVVTTSLGFLAALLAASADARAAYLIFVAAFAYVIEALMMRKADEFSVRLGSLGAFVAFGVAPSMIVLNVLLAVHPALLVLPLLYLLAAAISITRYDLSRRLTGLPAAVNGFVIPALLIADFFTATIVAGWLILSSALMALELGLRSRKGRSEYVVKEPAEEKKDAPDGFVPLSQW
ncbi:MAG: hypothetical protein HY366_01930 [Candidatus Aenigmarchaeota archaeon]|nr:hypothetical protein [Candidatus Aenigmarchaeota archaeon]